MRPALYAGAVISLWPLMGIQIPLAFAVALLVRANVMVAAALQFLTNPFTAAPIYYFTYRVGEIMLGRFGGKPAELPSDPSEEVIATAATPEALTTGIPGVVAALFIGGTVCGLILAALLDMIYLYLRRPRGLDRKLTQNP